MESLASEQQDLEIVVWPEGMAQDPLSKESQLVVVDGILQSCPGWPTRSSHSEPAQRSEGATH